MVGDREDGRLEGEKKKQKRRRRWGRARARRGHVTARAVPLGAGGIGLPARARRACGSAGGGGLGEGHAWARGRHPPALPPGACRRVLLHGSAHAPPNAAAGVAATSLHAATHIHRAVGIWLAPRAILLASRPTQPINISYAVVSPRSTIVGTADMIIIMRVPETRVK